MLWAWPPALALLAGLVVPAAVLLPRLRQGPRCRILVKLGGSACTDKAAFETVHQERLKATARQLAETRSVSSEENRVLLHGAGSFGHFHARKYAIKHGSAHEQHSPLGFALTRSSVTRLNGLVVSALLEAEQPAVSLHPFPSWRKRRNSPLSGVAMAAEASHAWGAGLLPVLHGDAVHDEHQGCAVLSGDEIMVELARCMRPGLCIFLTDVAGVYDRPPEQPGATLLSEIRVGRGGALRVVRDGGASASESSAEITTSVAAHDVTGGLAAKLRAAAAIAARGTPVLIVQAGTAHSAAALAGERPLVGTLLLREGARWPRYV
tara:strand:- start:2734 stop:3699 length:966 start_codon:yes stop_codon:yes gene_type:complete